LKNLVYLIKRMPQCMSCKSRGSRERCTAKALIGMLVCGRHAKVKKPNLWSDTQSAEQTVIQIQAKWRGYFVRKQLSLAGPGVLRRSLCHNEEDLVTGVEKTRQHPLDYFAFEEGGKVWWFDCVTILRWSVENVQILNPYTKQPLSPEVRKRMRDLYHLRIRLRRSCISSDDPQFTPEKITQIRAIRFTQQMHEAGFADIHPEDILGLSNGELWTFVSFLVKDMFILSSEHPSPDSPRREFLSWIESLLQYQLKHFGYYKLVQRRVLGVLLGILAKTVDPFPFCFVFASALYRV